MSVTLSGTNGVEFENNSEEVVTSRFKTTEENRSQGIQVAVTAETKANIEEMVFNSVQWRSFSHLVNDAIIYYLDGASGDTSMEHIIEETEWNSDNYVSAAITPTVADEIDLLVKHGHTEWDTKQEFYVCALFCYIGAGMPVVERR